MGVSERTNVQPNGWWVPPTVDVTIGGSAATAPVIFVSDGSLIPEDLAGDLHVEVVDPSPDYTFMWYSGVGASYGGNLDMFISGEASVPLVDQNTGGGGIGPTGLSVSWTEGDPYDSGDSWETSVSRQASSPPTLTAVGDPTVTRTVLVEVVTGAPTYTFRYTLGSSPARVTAMARGTAVPLLEEDDSTSGLVVTWANLAAHYPTAAWSWEVTASTLTLTAPADGAALTGGQTVRVAWTGDGLFPSGVNVELSLDAGATWTTLRAAMAATGTYEWPVPIVDASAARVRVVDASGDLFSDTASVSIARPVNTAHGRMLRQLLPRGPVWRDGGLLTPLLDTMGYEYRRVEQRAVALVEEADPRTATETLPEWERLMGLPDPDVQVIPATVEGRRLAVTQKVVKTGGQSRAYFTTLAAACGYTVTISEDLGASVFRTGRARAGQPLNSERWAHVWEMQVAAPSGIALSQAELERIIRRVAPAHTVVRFTYL